MGLLTFKKASNPILFFPFLAFAGNWFFPFRHRPQKYTNKFGFKPSNPIRKNMKTILFWGDK